MKHVACTSLNKRTNVSYTHLARLNCSNAIKKLWSIQNDWHTNRKIEQVEWWSWWWISTLVWLWNLSSVKGTLPVESKETLKQIKTHKQTNKQTNKQNNNNNKKQKQTKERGKMRLKVVAQCKFETSYGYWLYVLVMSRTRFRVNPHSIVAWMSRNSLLKAGTKSEG